MIGTSLMHCIKFCFVFIGVSGDSQLDSCPDPTLTLVLGGLANQRIYFVRRNEKIWLALETAFTQGKWSGELSQPSLGSTHVDE